MTHIQVSIIVPVYNVAPYIERCVKSVEAQEYTDGLECLLVDDCGQDSSIQIATQLIEEYLNSEEYKNCGNGHYYIALNAFLNI